MSLQRSMTIKTDFHTTFAQTASKKKTFFFLLPAQQIHPWFFFHLTHHYQ